MNSKHINFDIDHNHKYLEGITRKENYINQADETIAGTIIPAGSWMMVLEINNTTLNNKLRNGDITGVSLWTDLSDDVILLENILERTVKYKNIKNKDAMYPSSISFTDHPANRLPIEVWTSNQYTAKNNKNNQMEDENMTNENNVTWYQKVIEGLIKHNTAKTNPTPQPLDDGVSQEELIETLIASQKSIPKLTELVEKQQELSVKQTEEISNLKGTIEELRLKVSELELKNNSSTDNDSTGDNAADEGTDDVDSTNTNDNPNDNPDNKDNNNDNDDEPTDNNTNDDTSDDDPDDKKHTAKTTKTMYVEQPIQETQDALYEFMKTRTYNSFMNK